MKQPKILKLLNSFTAQKIKPNNIHNQIINRNEAIIY